LTRLNSLVLCAVSLSSALWAQNGASLVEVGYSAPSTPEVAPGQVVTLFFRGVKPLADGRLRAARAAGVPLPDTLAGLSAKLWQDGRYLAMPLFEVRQDNECAQEPAASPECLLTSMRVQIPYELNLITAAGGAGGQSHPAPAQEFVLEEDGRAGRRFPLRPAPDNAHVVTSCDIARDSGPDRACNRQAYHADGRAADAQAPARRGESVVVYAYGLGPTDPAAETGKAAPADARIPESGRRRVWVNLLDSPINASASLPRAYHPQASQRTAIPTEFTGLTPGAAGLYQLNVRIPESFRPALACGGEVLSNAILLVTTDKGTEAAPLCVAE
jgi:hypothetical protein